MGERKFSKKKKKRGEINPKIKYFRYVLNFTTYYVILCRHYEKLDHLKPRTSLNIKTYQAVFVSALRFIEQIY